MAVSKKKDRSFVVLLDEPIDMKKTIGKGSFGAVYEVKVNGASCIAKILHDILTGSRGHQPVAEDQLEHLMTKFLGEYHILSKLRHPNVVQCLGICQPSEDSTDVALIMERLHMDLHQFITDYKEVLAPTTGPVSNSNDVYLTVKLHILHDVCCGLLHIHSQGLIHRDLNARNVLLTENLQAKVADLGAARVLLSGSMTKGPGAFDYMPPEAMIDSPKYSFSLDVFSLGHLMLYLVSCVYPAPRDLFLDQVDSFAKKSSLPLGMQALKRREALDQVDDDHCTVSLIVECLGDKPEERPSLESVEKKLGDLCLENPKSFGMVYFLLSKRTESSYEEEIKQLKQTKQEVVKDNTKYLQMISERTRELELLRSKYDEMEAQLTESERKKNELQNFYDEIEKAATTDGECSGWTPKYQRQQLTNQKSRENDDTIRELQRELEKAKLEVDRLNQQLHEKEGKKSRRKRAATEGATQLNEEKTTTEGIAQLHEKKKGLAGKVHWIEKRVTRRNRRPTSHEQSRDKHQEGDSDETAD